MRRHRSRRFTILMATAVCAACTDTAGPVPVTLGLSVTRAMVKAGDSVLVDIVPYDAQGGGSFSAAGATWTSIDPAVATVRPVTGTGATGRAWIIAQAAAGGATWVRVSALGLTDSVRVVSLPRRLPAGLVTVTGIPRADTLLGVAYLAGDTVVVDAGPTLRFDSANTYVRFRGSRGYVLSRGSTRFKVLARGPYRGRVTVTELRLAADTSVHLDTLATVDSFQVARARFRGSVAVLPSALGSGTLLTLTANGREKFNANATVTIGAQSLIILSRTDSTGITAASPVPITGNPRITGARVGGVTLDSLYTPGDVALGGAYFPGSVTGTGVLSSPITVDAGGAAFTVTGVYGSNVLINGVMAFVVSRSASTMTVVAKVGGTAAVTVTNVLVGGTTIPQVSTAGTFAVNADGTGEANEPANDGPGGATVVPGTVASPLVIYGTVDDARDTVDLWTTTLGAPATVTLRLEFTGSGAGVSGNPDLDLLFCDAACTTFVGGSGGATASQPENLSIPNLAAGTYSIVVLARVTGGETYTYKLTASAQ